MFPLLELGPLMVPVAGLLLLAGLWLGLEVAERTAPHFSVPAEHIYGLTFGALLLGFVGARAGYVLQYLDSYLRDPRAIFALNGNTLDRTTGLVIGVLAALVYLRWHRLPLRQTLDSLTPGLALFALFLGVAHLASGNAFGAPTDVPWAIELWDARRHPSQVYEIAVALPIFLVVWRLRRVNPYPGFLFAVWLALAAASRLVLEAYRGDSVIVADSLRQTQLAALVLILFSLWLLGHWAQVRVTELGEPSAELLGAPTGDFPRPE